MSSTEIRICSFVLPGTRLSFINLELNYSKLLVFRSTLAQRFLFGFLSDGIAISLPAARRGSRSLSDDGALRHLPHLPARVHRVRHQNNRQNRVRLQQGALSLHYHRFG